MQVDKKSLREALGDYDYRLCSQNSPEVVDLCISRSKIFVESFYKNAEREDEYDEYDDYVSQIIFHRAKFELYTKGRIWEMAKLSKIEAQSMLVARLGQSANIYKDDNLNSEQKPAAISVSVKNNSLPKVNWKAY